MTSKSSFGVLGLGVMGKSLAFNIASKGFNLSVYNRDQGKEKEVVSDFLDSAKSSDNVIGYTDLGAFVRSLQRPRKILIMVPAAVLDVVIEDLKPFLQEDDIIIDGGNSHYQLTKKRVAILKNEGIVFIGIGISGGEQGALIGPSIMPGGDIKSYSLIKELLESIAATDFKGGKCVNYVSKDGAGHFVKMIHNGIEYGEMQLLAEVITLLKSQMDYQQIADLFKQWNTGDLQSYLLEITSQILQVKEGGGFLLDKILDKAGNKGTGSWSSIAALENGIPANIMAASVFARYVSSFKDNRVSLSRKRARKNSVLTKIDVITLEKAYRTARLINHHQGFAIIKEVSDKNDWNIDLSELARIWTGGCIIKSTLMEELVSAFKSKEMLIYNGVYFEKMIQSEEALSKVLIHGIKNRYSLPCFHATQQYWVAITTDKLSANVIQAQRDYFGAHKYQRNDRPDSIYFHTNWKES